MKKDEQLQEPSKILRCLSKDVTLVSLRIKNNTITHESVCIIHRAEKGLLNECLRNINNTVDHCEQERYMYSEKLASSLEPELYEECEILIKPYILRVLEGRKN